MGCLWDKSEWEELEDFIAKAIKRTKLNNKHCDKISKSFHRTTLHFHLTQMQLKESLGYLKIDPTEEVLNILNHFLEYPRDCKFIDRQDLRKDYGNDYTVKMYSVKKITTFGLLVGEGSILEKSQCLFSIYDIDASNNLSKWEITVLLNDVLEIALEKIPEITSMLYPDVEENIKKYQERLRSMKQNYLELFKYLLLEDKKKDMTGSEFVDSMDKEDMIGILDNSLLRRTIIKNYENCRDLYQEMKNEESTFKDDGFALGDERINDLETSEVLITRSRSKQ